MPRRRFRYQRYGNGPDPLAAPFDLGDAVDSIGDSVLAGSSSADALRTLMRQGAPDGGGLDDLARRVRRRQRALRRTNNLEGTLDDVRRLLDQAVEHERTALFPDPSDDARMREAELDLLPDDTARAVRELSSYLWRSPEAAAAYQAIRELLTREVLDQQFAGLRAGLRAAAGEGGEGGADAQSAAQDESMRRVKDMLADLNQLLDAAARGEDVDQAFQEFMARHGELFPDNPDSLDELIEQLARRAAAGDRLMRSLPPEAQEELEGLLAQARRDLDLSAELARLGDNLRALRPDLFRPGRERMSGEHGLGLADATEVLAELSDLDALAEQLGQDYPGASLDDIDEELVRRALGRPAVDDLQRLRTTERELERQGYLDRTDGRLELSPKAVRRLGLTALRRVFSSMQAPGRGDHDVQDAGATGELTGSSRQWTYGDEQPLDVVRTIANAVRHRAPHEPIRLRPDDFEVRESERRSRAAVCLLVDMSYSMVINGTWGAAKSTALALQALMTSSYPQDALQIIGFSDYARVLQPTELAGLDSAMVQGTNVQHALMLAGRFIGRHHDAEPVVMLVTDGEPTAHLLRDGTSWFSWPPERETLSLTMAEVDKLARRQATVNVFVLGDDPRLREFVDDLAKRAGGRVFATDADNLGAYLVTDFAARRARILRGRRKAG